jgi:hypothetical protein
VESLFDEEEALLTLHMEVLLMKTFTTLFNELILSFDENILYEQQVIQENAELLTEEGRLLQQVCHLFIHLL